MATLQFDAVAQPVDSFLNFLQLDFLTNNTVRLDDGLTTFGSFQRDPLFSVVISLTIGASGAPTTISPFGAASGSLTLARDHERERQRAGRFPVGEKSDACV